MIKFRKIITIAIIILNIINTQVFTQEPVPVEISKNKVSLDGKLYYIHTVREKQTLHSISKAYNVPINDIIKLNPGVQYGLQVNQSIKIPITKTINENKVTYDTAKVSLDSEFIKHITTPGETLYSISKKYDITLDTLIFLNPGLQYGLKAGMVLDIPAKKQEPESGMNIVLEKRTITHKVRRKDNLLSISHKYNIPVSSIIRNNKELMMGGLKPGQIIEITIIDTVFNYANKGSLIYDTIDTIVNKDQYFRLFTNQDNYNLNNLNINYPRNKRDTIDVTILLPFNYNRLAELDNYIDTCENKAQVRWAKKKKREIKFKSDFYTDFYLGTLLALDSIKKLDVSIKLNVYDTQSDSNVVRYLINKYDLENSDFIIGPPEPASINMVLDYLGNTDVKIILPNSNVNNLDKYSNVYQVIPSEEALKEHLSYYIATQYKKNIILVCNDDSISRKESLMTKGEILRYMDFYNTLDSAILKEVYFNDTMTASLQHALNLDKENLVVILSRNEAFISNIIRELYNIRTDDLKISILGNDSWTNMLYNNNIDIKYLHSLNIIYYRPFYYEYSNKKVINFLNDFRQKFKSEPYYQVYGINPVLLGYDMFLYFIQADVALSHPSLKNSNDNLLADFEFIQKEKNGGYENISVTFISYDWDIKVTAFKPYKLNFQQTAQASNIK